MEWRGDPRKGSDPVEVRRGLPGDAADTQSRYIEAAVAGVLVACLYLPNGNPQPGPKFEYKLAWFERLIRHASTLYASGHPMVLAGDFNVVPTDDDIYNPRLGSRTHCCSRRLANAINSCWSRDGPMRYAHAIPTPGSIRSGTTFVSTGRRTGLRIDHLLLSRGLAQHMRDAGVDKWVRGEPHASDHAPAWVEIEMGAEAKTKTTPAARARRWRRARDAPKTVMPGLGGYGCVPRWRIEPPTAPISIFAAASIRSFEPDIRAVISPFWIAP
jgi:exodeoxyribonuclease-3